MIDVSRRKACYWIAATALGAAVPILSGRPAIAQAAGIAIPPGYLPHPQRGLVLMTTDLRKLDIEHFETLIGQTFTIADHSVVLRGVHRGPETPTQFREQFSLIFDVPDHSPIRSEVVTVSHPAIGSHDLLVTQVMAGESQRALEICFS